MRRSNSLKVISASLLGCGLFAQGAMAEGESGARISAEIRGAMVQTDVKVFETAELDSGGAKPISVVPERAKINFLGTSHSNVDFRLRFDLLKFGHTVPGGTKAAGSPVDYLHMTWWVTKEIGVRFGQDKVAQGGWEKLNFTLSQMYKNKFYKAPLATFKPMISLMYKFMGTAEFQIFDDNDSDNVWNNADSPTHPTFALQWKGKVMNGMLKPLVQYTSWDNNKNMSYAVATGFNMKEISGSVGYLSDTMTAKAEGTDDLVKTAFHVEGAYNASGFEPFFYYGGYSATDDSVGSTISAGLRIKKDKNITPFIATVMSKLEVTEDKTLYTDVASLKAGLYAKF